MNENSKPTAAELELWQVLGRCGPSTVQRVRDQLDDLSAEKGGSA